MVHSASPDVPGTLRCVVPSRLFAEAFAPRSRDGALGPPRTRPVCNCGKNASPKQPPAAASDSGARLPWRVGGRKVNPCDDGTCSRQAVPPTQGRGGRMAGDRGQRMDPTGATAAQRGNRTRGKFGELASNGAKTLPRAAWGSPNARQMASKRCQRPPVSARRLDRCRDAYRVRRSARPYWRPPTRPGRRIGRRLHYVRRRPNR